MSDFFNCSPVACVFSGGLFVHSHSVFGATGHPETCRESRLLPAAKRRCALSDLSPCFSTRTFSRGDWPRAQRWGIQDLQSLLTGWLLSLGRSPLLCCPERQEGAAVPEVKQRKGLELREAVSSLTRRFPPRALFSV